MPFSAAGAHIPSNRHPVPSTLLYQLAFLTPGIIP